MAHLVCAREEGWRNGEAALTKPEAHQARNPIHHHIPDTWHQGRWGGEGRGGGHHTQPREVWREAHATWHQRK